MELNNITNTGTWSEQATRLNDNFNKVALGIDTLQEMYESLSQSAIEVVATLPQTGKANKIYRLVGTTSYSDYMYNADDLTAPILMATYDNAIDDVPTAGSNNLVKSGGIYNELVKKVEIIPENIYNGNWEVGCLHVDGEVYPSHETFRTTDYIHLDAGQMIMANVGISFHEGDYPTRLFTTLCIYNVNQEFQEALKDLGEFFYYTVQSECYVRISCLADIENYYVVYGDKKMLSKQVLENTNELKSLCIPENFYSEQYEVGCLHVDGEVYPSHETFRTTDYIHLDAGQMIMANVGISFHEGDYPTRLFTTLCIYNVNQEFQEALKDLGEFFYYTVQSECYVRISCLTDTGDYYVFYGDKKISSKQVLDVIYKLQNPISNISKWKGKKVGFLGDSITAGGMYVNAYQALTGANTINYGVSGTTIADGGISNPMCTRYTSMASDLDLVVVLGGVNDQRTGVPIGEFKYYNSDGSLNSNFYGALHTLARGLKEKYPTKPIVFMTPMHNSYRDGTYGDTGDYNYQQFQQGILVENKFPLLNGTTIDDSIATGDVLSKYVAAIKEVCAFYAIPVIDLYSISTMQPLLNSNKQLYMPDGIHPTTQAGGQRIANVIYPFLEDLKY